MKGENKIEWDLKDRCQDLREMRSKCWEDRRALVEDSGAGELEIVGCWWYGQTRRKRESRSASGSVCLSVLCRARPPSADPWNDENSRSAGSRRLGEWWLFTKLLWDPLQCQCYSCLVQVHRLETMYCYNRICWIVYWFSQPRWVWCHEWSSYSLTFTKIQRVATHAEHKDILEFLIWRDLYWRRSIRPKIKTRPK